MLWLETVLFGAVALTALAWAALSAYILGVQRRRETTARDPGIHLRARSSDGRISRCLIGIDAVRPLLGVATRELVMHAAADRDLSNRGFETLVALLDERWTLASLVRDASRHVSRRDRWRRMTSLRILARLEHPRC